MATTSPYHIASLLDKMASSDKDFRYMATNDLMTELQKDSIKLDDDRERLVVQSLLRLLEDKNGEVQNLAVKCLGPLVKKVKEYQVEWIVDTLCTNMTSNKEQLRDISSIGLKTVISELPSASSPLSSTICKRITGRLIDAITKTEDQSVQLEALDILADLLSRFGGLLVSFHPSILKCILPLLTSQRLAIRKRTIIALSHLVMTANASLFVELMTHLINELKTRKNHVDVRTFIQCIGAICRQSGRRVGEYLEKVIPIIVEYSQVESDDELRETCIQTLESFVCKCPKEITPYIGQVTDLCLEFLCYDPNYNYGDENENSMDVNDDYPDDDLDDDDEEEYSDDDDMSWKVRRSSAKCLASILGSRHELIKGFYSKVSPKLIARFKEREENVKSDIFQAYVALLRQTRPIASSDTVDNDDSLLKMLHDQVPMVINALHKQMQEKSVKTRLGCFNLLTELVTVLPGALSEHIHLIVPGIHMSIIDKSAVSNMKIDALSFLGCILHQHKPEVFFPHMEKLLPVVVTSIKDPFYKITSEALGVAQNAIKVIRPLDKKTNFDYTVYVSDLYKAVFFRLQAADIDQEVKEKSISCMGQLLCNLGDCLTPELQNCLPIMLDRLRNEITRLTAVKALIMITNSPLKLDIMFILKEAVPLLATFLRKNHRGLKLSTLTCLDIIIRQYGDAMSDMHFETVLTELPDLISENDLHISQLALNLLTSIAKKQSSLLKMIKQGILPVAILLTQSPLLQGNALNSMILFLNELVVSGEPGLGYADLLQLLTIVIFEPSQKHSEKVPLAVHRMAFHSIAKCVAALTMACQSEAKGVIDKFVADVTDTSASESVQLFSLLAIGEIGSHMDLSDKPRLKTVIINAFSSDSEDIKSAASYALGHITVGNLTVFLPFILQEIEKNAKRQYLLLHSLKEVISCQSIDSKSIEDLQPFLQAIWELLFSHCENGEEGTRNIVAECLGKLTLVDPVNLLPLLQKYLSSSSAQMRSTVITAFKFTISDQPQPIDVLLKDCLRFFLQPITDQDLNVRRVSLTTLNSASHNKPRLIRDLLPDILPHLYNETKVRKDLIREVEMGPFKHTVDDGLDIRKAAFECMYTLLHSCLDRLDIFEFLNHVEDGLKDHYDIKMLTYLMLVRLSSLCPNAVLQHLDRIIEPLRSTVQAKVKANSVKQEYEKQDELKRSALRAISSLQQIQDADINPLLTDFITQIRSNSDISAMFEAVQRDPSTTSILDAMDISP